jgi:broad specificity phosphatase PhoE
MHDSESFADREEHTLRRIVLVRHCYAGRRSHWPDDDIVRPLDSTGWAQAQWLVGVLTPVASRRIVSSPYLRCRQSIEPLAQKLELHVELSEDLAPDAGLKTYEMIRSLSIAPSLTNAILCTHGEAIRVALGLVASEERITLERRLPGVKGSVWTLNFIDGELASARYATPPRSIRPRKGK